MFLSNVDTGNDVDSDADCNYERSDDNIDSSYVGCNFDVDAIFSPIKYFCKLIRTMVQYDSEELQCVREEEEAREEGR